MFEGEAQTHFPYASFSCVSSIFLIEHHSEKKNLAATCIQNTWRLHHFIQENTDALMMGDWFRSQKLRMFQHKLAGDLRRWRVARRSWSRGTCANCSFAEGREGRKGREGREGREGRAVSGGRGGMGGKVLQSQN